MSVRTVITKKEKLLQLPVPGIEPGRVILRAGSMPSLKNAAQRDKAGLCASSVSKKPFSR